jgi:phage terminase large subunit-like protein
MPKYEPSKKLLTWPNGFRASVYSSEEYDELRGPQHHLGWADEPAKYRYLEQTLDNFFFGLRLGANPQACFTTTPRNVAALRGLLKDPLTVVTRGPTDDNLGNLSPVYQAIVRKYRGTRLGRQELNAELLEDTPGALWTLAVIDRTRLGKLPEGVDLVRAVVAVDPQAKSAQASESKKAERLVEEEQQTETGIVVAARGSDDRGYVLADMTISGRPEAWAARAVAGYRDFSADRIVGEANNGGEMVEAVIKAQDRHVPVRLVHASRGKVTRAEPISLLYERGIVSHVGAFSELEDQMTTWVPGDRSPDRMDALVWALTELFGRDLASMVDDSHFAGALGAKPERHVDMNLDRGSVSDLGDMNLGVTSTGGMNL